MSVPMTLNVQIRGDRAAVVTVTGDVDGAGVSRLGDLLQLAETEIDLLIDLSGVTHLDSPAIALLVCARDACVDSGGSMMVLAPRSPVRHALDAAVLDAGLTLVNKPAARRTRETLPVGGSGSVSSPPRAARHQDRAPNR